MNRKKKRTSGTGMIQVVRTNEQTSNNNTESNDQEENLQNNVQMCEEGLSPKVNFANRSNRNGSD